MLTLEGCLARRKRLWSSLPADVEWILVADPRHVQYLCNFWVQPLSFSTGERGWLCLERSGRATLLGDNFACAGVHKPFVDREIVEKCTTTSTRSSTAIMLCSQLSSSCNRTQRP